MAKKKPMTLAEEVEHEEKYILFLRTRLDSENYKANVTPEEYDNTQQKYEKAKFRLKILRERLNPRK